MDLRRNSFTVNDTKISESVVGWKTIPKKLPIPLKELKYSTKGDESEIRIVFAFYDSNDTLIEQVENYGTNGESMTIVAPENSSKFLVSCLLGDENEKVYISDGSYLSLRVRNYSKDLNYFYNSFDTANFQEEVVCDDYSIANYGRFEPIDSHKLRKIINGYNNSEEILVVNYSGYSPILNTKILNNKKIVFCGRSSNNQFVNSFIYDCNDLTNGKTGLHYVYDVIYRNGKYYILSSQSVDDVYYLVIGETNGDDFSTLVFTRPTFSSSGNFIKSGSINFKFNVIDDNVSIIFKNQGSGTSVVSDDIYSVNLETKELTLITRTSGFSILDVYGNYMAINASGTLVFEYVNSNYVPTRTLNTALTLNFNAGARRVYKLIYDVLNNQFLLTGSNLYKFDKEFTSCDVVTNISYTDTSILNYRYLNLNLIQAEHCTVYPMNAIATSDDYKEIYGYLGDKLSFGITPNEGYKITGFSDIGIDCKTELLEDGSELIVTIPAYSGNTLAPSFEVYTESSYPITTGYYYLKEPNLTEEVNVSMQQLSIIGKTEKNVRFNGNEIFVDGEMLDVSRDDISRLFYVENEFQAPNLEFMSYMESCKVDLKAYKFNVTLDRGFSSYTMTGTIFPYKEYYVAFNKFFLTFNLKNGFEVDSIKSNRGRVFSNKLEYETHPRDPEPDTGRHFKFKITATSAIDYIEISLYNNKADSIVVDKTSSLERIGMIRGTLKANTDIMNPVIQFEYVGLPNFNYVYIDKLKRYYYVDNIINNNLRIWTMNLRVDVLNSFKEGIGELYANVERNQYDYNSEIEDNLVSFTSEKNINIYQPEHFVDESLGMEQIAFDEEIALKENTQENGTNIIISFKGKIYDLGSTEGTSYSPNQSVLPSVSIAKSPVPSSVLLTNTFYLNNFLAQVSESDSTFVKSIIALPFNLGRCFYEPDTSDTGKMYKSVTLKNLSEFHIKIDGEAYKGNFYEIETEPQADLSTWKKFPIPYIYHYDFIFNNKSSRVGYLKKEPYTTYEIFIPYVGWREISSSYLGDRIQIIYSLNVEDGTSNVNVIDQTKNLLISTYMCQLGIRIPVDTTNNEYLSIQKQQNTNNMIMSTLSTGVNATVGIAAGYFSGNPIAMAGGVMSATRAITSVASSGMNYHNSNMSLIEKAQCTISSGVNGNYCLNKVMIKETYNETNNEPITRYYGKPLLEQRQLKNLRGITKVGDIISETSYPNYITNSEKNEIKLLLKDKVILPSN